MPSRAYYLPRSEPALLVWFTNWATKIQIHGTLLGLSAPEKAQALTDLAVLTYCINVLAQYKNFLSEWVAYKDIMLYAPINTPVPAIPVAPTAPTPIIGTLAAIVKRCQQINERIRPHPAMTEAIAEDLGIIGPEITLLTKPENVAAVARPHSEVETTYSKGTFAGVAVYGKRGDETTWTLLAIDTNSPYIDTRPPLVAGQPETRTYRFRLYDGDEEVGDFSDEVSVVTIP